VTPSGTDGRFKPLSNSTAETYLHRGAVLMGLVDDAKNKAEELAGKAKQKIGEVTGNDDLKAEGKKDEAKGDVKQAGEKVKDVLD
jgi:uncharacterized protein YjbJ (UPF0337 family)